MFQLDNRLSAVPASQRPIIPSSHCANHYTSLSVRHFQSQSHSHFRLRCVSWPSRILATAFTLIKAVNVVCSSYHPLPVTPFNFGHQFNCEVRQTHLSLLPAWIHEAFERHSAPGWCWASPEVIITITIPCPNIMARESIHFASLQFTLMWPSN